MAPMALGAQHQVKVGRGKGDTTVTTRPVDGVVRTGRDSLKRDSTHQKRGEIVIWDAPDSVLEALLARQGYTVTRYQGSRVTFDARKHRLDVVGTAAIQRGQTTLVADTVIYDDSTKTVLAASAQGDTSILRDPSQGSDDVLSRRITYDIRRQQGTISELSTSVEEGQRWFVHGDRAGFASDTASQQRTIYARDGSVTSCDLTYPHYHFEVKEVKLIQGRLLVARPAVLYIADIPVMILPFLFQDMRSGRRSGILPPRVGVGDIVRSSTSYRRQIENIGYYFALSDYADAEASLDWRSGAAATDGDPGWTRYNGELRYHWLDRFLTGRLGVSRSSFTTGNTNTAISWQHQQDLSQQSHLNANFNYVTSTTLQRQQSFNIAQALAVISSLLNFQNQLGPANFSVGGSRRQYPGRAQVDQEFPNFSVTTRPITAGSWLAWSPQLAVNNAQQFNLDAAGASFGFRYFTNAAGVLDSSAIKRDARNSSLSFQTPFRIFDFNWRNSITVSDVEHDYPEERTITTVSGVDTTRTTRVYERTFLTSVDYQTGIDLPRIGQGRFNIVPSVQISNVDPHGYWVRSERTGGEYVHQSKRLQYSLNATPTLFGFLPGFGPFTRIRHSITPSVSYGFAPAAKVSEAFLAALGSSSAGYLGNLAQNQVSFGLTQNFEAKLRSRGDSNPDAGEKIRLLALNFSSITYDFERARKTRASGFTTPSFSYSARSDLLPGFDLNVGYSLFQGDPLSDTARFKPYRDNINATFTVSRGNNPFAVLTRLFGQAVPRDSATVPAASQAGGGIPGGLAQSPRVGGGASSRFPIGISEGQGWEASLSFSSNRQRPPVGTGPVIIFDPRTKCQGIFDPIVLGNCIRQNQQPSDTVAQTTAGGRFVRFPPTSTLRGNFSLTVTPKWAVQWTTGYDFTRSQFADHQVTLQRSLHDWRAIWAFTQAPNGNFAFNFFIALNAEPDLKFNYDRRTYHPGF
ncbi:MAG: putative LPS assembly protein LptD [Gemmatimonadaceae bacterium]